ncbi:MAG: alanine racemase [Clostridia bacterium]|nr:alanine racemase [Clostridia bacterium]
MSYLRRAWAEIDLEAIAKNYDAVCNMTNTQVIPIIKADAYGHGAVKVAQILKGKSVGLFAVSTLDEAEELRLAGITSDILILGYTPPSCAKDLAEYNLIQTIYSAEYATELNESAKHENVKIRTHVKLDTGMGRIGFNFKTELDNVKMVLKLSNLENQGIFTHFSCADSQTKSDVDYTEEQYARFCNAINVLENHGFSFKMKHCSNSGAILTNNKTKMDAVRGGIILYGVSPSKDLILPVDFTPAMSFYSVISMVKEVEADSELSYGRTYKTESKRKIATVSAGYSDGVPRLLSNKGTVLVGGKRANIVGRICMDQFLIDVTDIENVKAGDVVTIFGKDLSVHEVADNAQTIGYEILCGISKRVPRIYK